MARYELSGTFALTAGAAKTVLRFMTPGTRKGTLRKLEIVDGEAAASDTGLLYRIMTGGTDGTGTTVTPTPMNGAAAVPSGTTAKANYTAEPTATTEVERNRIPAGGGMVLTYEGEEGIEIPHSSGIGIELTGVEARGSDVVGVKMVVEI